MTKRKSITDVPPGYFTALMRAENWPPRWEPVPLDKRSAWDEQRKLNAIAGRQKSVAEGKGYGDGTIKGLGRNAKGKS